MLLHLGPVLTGPLWCLLSTCFLSADCGVRGPTCMSSNNLSSKENRITGCLELPGVAFVANRVKEHIKPGINHLAH